MKDLLLRDERSLGSVKNQAPGFQDIPRSESSSFWKRFFKELSASFNAPFQSDWEKKRGLPWRDWGKL